MSAVDPDFARLLAQVDDMATNPLASPSYLFSLSNALAEFAHELALHGHAVRAMELNIRAVHCADVATDRSK